MSRIKYLTDSECDALYRAIGSEARTEKQKLKALRNQAMMLLSLEAGLRPIEVCSIKINALFFNGEVVERIHVTKETAKYGSERFIPTSMSLKRHIEMMWINIWGLEQNYSATYAFFTRDYKIPIAVRQYERILEKAAARCLNRHVNPHMLRHTFATKIARTSQLRVVQELLGHKSISTTQIYTHPNGEDLKDAIDQGFGVSTAGAG